MPMRLPSTVQILRPHNMLAAAFSVATGYYVAGGDDLVEIVILSLLTAAVTGAGNIINDYHDLSIDRVNKPRRPLPSGRLPAGVARRLYWFIAVPVTVVAFVALPMSVAFVIAIWQVLLFGYAVRIKRVFVVGNVLVAVVTSSAFLAGAILARDAVAAVIPIAIAFLFVLSREVVKGAEDIEGDRAAGVGTVAVVCGVRGAAMIAAATMLVLAAAMPLPAIAGYYGRSYFWVMQGVVVPGLIVSARWMLHEPQRREFSAVSWALKILMFFGILAILLGAR